MDIRVQSYRPVTVQTFGGNASTPRAVAVSDARQGGPVAAVAAVSPYRSGLNELAGQLSSQLRSASNGGGYTDSVRGSTLNILA